MKVFLSVILFVTCLPSCIKVTRSNSSVAAAQHTPATAEPHITAENQTCQNPIKQAAAHAALTQYGPAITAVGDLPKVEVGNCSELETIATTAERGFVCGVFLYFANSEQRETFHATTALWGGLLNVRVGMDDVKVPVCSRVVMHTLAPKP